MSQAVLHQGITPEVGVLSDDIAPYVPGRPSARLLLSADELTHLKEQLITHRNETSILYHGGPIEREDDKTGIKWMQPVVIEVKGKKAVYQLSYINCTPEDAEGAIFTPILSSDIGIKTRDRNTRCNEIYNSLLAGSDGKKRIVARRCEVANPMYPEVIFDLKPDFDQTLKHFSLLESSFREWEFHLNANADLTYLVGGNDVYGLQTSEEVAEIGSVKVFEARKIDTPDGQFYVYNVVRLDDRWKVYQLLTVVPLDELTDCGNNLVNLRIDSGCECGQVCGDNACDCAPQLWKAMRQVYGDFVGSKGENKYGMIVHIPAHDGRGYGTAPKGETELIKRGIQGRIHTVEGGLGPIEAAQLLYGESKVVDIRDYNGVVALLQLMGIRKVNLCTDNKIKYGALTKSGIEVKRETAADIEALSESTRRFVKAKLVIGESEDLYFSDVSLA